MGIGNVFRPEKIPSLSRLPKEKGRLKRQCERCSRETEQICYVVPKKVTFFYVKDHPDNLHATCVVCAKSEVLSGRERDSVLNPPENPANFRT